MVDASGIREHTEAIGANGGHVGTVDKVEGGRIKPTKQDRGAGGQHRWLPLSAVAEVEANAVWLSMTVDPRHLVTPLLRGGSGTCDADRRRDPAPIHTLPFPWHHDGR